MKIRPHLGPRHVQRNSTAGAPGTASGRGGFSGSAVFRADARQSGVVPDHLAAFRAAGKPIVLTGADIKEFRSRLQAPPHTAQYIAAIRAVWDGVAPISAGYDINAKPGAHDAANFKPV